MSTLLRVSAEGAAMSPPELAAHAFHVLAL